MKKTYFTTAWGLVTLWVAASCSGSAGTDAHGFGPAEELYADSVAIHEIVQPRRMMVSGDKMILQTHIGDSLIYVYRLPEVSFLYAGIRAGGGPGEIATRYPEFLPRREKDGEFSLLCNSRLYDFTAADSGFVFRGEKRLYQSAPDEMPAFDVDYVTVEDNVDADRKDTYLYMYDLRTGAALDSVPSRAVYHENRNSGNFENASWGVQNAGMYAAVYPETGRVEFYDISGGKFVLGKAWGDDTPVEQLKNTDFSGREKGTDYYVARTDGKYLYILENHYVRTDETDRMPVASYVLVYGWNGDPVKKYWLDKPVDGMMAAAGRLYAFNWAEDFEKLYVYDMTAAGK